MNRASRQMALLVVVVGTAAVAFGAPAAVAGSTAVGAAPPARAAPSAENAASLLAAGEHLPGRVMVTLPAASLSTWTKVTRQLEIAHRLREASSWSMRALGVRCVVFEVRPGRDLERVIERLAADRRVETAQPIYTFAAVGESGGGGGDPYRHLQHGAEALGLGPVHRFATGKGVTVAVIDTGVDVHHPDLAGRIARTGNFVGAAGGGGDFFRDVHGTAVAGILAAAADNDVGIAGVAPEAKVMALKACWQPKADEAAAVCDSYSLVKAFDFALAEGAQVVNMSLAGPRDPLLARLIATALDREVTVVAAARRDGQPGFPASLPGVIAVRAGGVPSTARAPGEAVAAAGAAADTDRLLAAPGVDILTTVPGGGYDFFSGSSMAAAQVSGVAALVLERRPGLAPAEVARLLRETSRPIGGVPRATGAALATGAVPALPGASPPPATVVEAQVDACGAVSRLLGEAVCGPPAAAGLVR